MFKLKKFIRALFSPLRVVGEYISANLGIDIMPVEPFIIPESATTEKSKLTSRDESIIGIRDAVLIQNPKDALDVNKFDTTTYADRAVLQLANATGSSKVINGLCIRGKLVVMSAGQSGYVWEYSDFDDIEKNGERYFEISNDYMMDPGQVEAVGDFCWKALKPHNVYQLQLVGCQHQYRIGDFYQLTVDYKLPAEASEIESIDVPVEVMNVSFSRTVGEVGQTVLTVRQAIGTWSKSTPRRARLIGAGFPQFLLNRGNNILVASSTYTGQADYYCDGVDDDVEIQAAIDEISLAGGGEVELTNGEFNLSTSLIMKNSTNVIGYGSSTVLIPKNNTILTMVDWGTAIDSKLSLMAIDGKGAEITYTGIGLLVINGRDLAKCENVFVRNYSIAYNGATSINAFLFRSVASISGCTADGNTVVSSSGTISFVCFSICKNVIDCRVSDTATSGNVIYIGYANSNQCVSCNVASGAGTHTGYFAGFILCDGISSCSVSQNTFTSSAPFRAYFLCNNIASSVSSTNSTNTGECIGFYGCTQISCCSTFSNTSVSGTVYGFRDCKSMQQNKSTDATPYTSSYADSGTANLCDDTAAGGYNS